MPAYTIAGCSGERVEPIAQHAALVRACVQEPRPDRRTGNRDVLAHYSLAQISLYAAAFVGRAVRRVHDPFGPDGLIIEEGRADYSGAANLGVAHWAMEDHDPAARHEAGIDDDTVWRLTAMMVRSIAWVAPLLQRDNPTVTS